MSRLIQMLLLIFGAMVIYQKRYQILNLIFSVKILRSLMVKSAFSIPGLREKVISQMF